jgi:precorrin-6Y C5,15-methyltransferase (decarboxylating)
MPAGGPLPAADLYVGAPRWLAAAPPAAARVPLGDLGAALDAIAAAAGPVCVLASGDPGFFGIVRALAARFGPGALDVRPAPSSVSLAFARLGLPWDDAVVVSAHGRPLADAARVAAGAPKAAVLVSPESPPEALGKELLACGADPATQVAVCTRLGLDGERVSRTDLAGLAAGTWDPLSVVVLLRDAAPGGGPALAWAAAAGAGGGPARVPAATPGGTAPAPGTAGAAGGDGPLPLGLPEERYAHRGGMITKAEVRAVVLAKLALPATGVLWDVGAGSGSVALEAAALRPGLAVFAVDRDATHLRANAAGSRVAVVEGEAPAALGALPDPDRAFVGGGGLGVLEAVAARLRPGGRIVATYAALDRAVAAARRLGSLVQVAVSRGEPLPDGSLRLAAENPVFVVWGPTP